MSYRSQLIIGGTLFVVALAGLVIFFQYYPFEWWLLIGPALAIPLVFLQQRRQRHWDEVRASRERDEDRPSN